MASLVILYWRDIPTQVIAREGRVAARRELPRIFIEAVDRAAMRAGAAGTDDYLAGWRKSAPAPCGDDLEGEVAVASGKLEAAYGRERLAMLAENGGFEP